MVRSGRARRCKGAQPSPSERAGSEPEPCAIVERSWWDQAGMLAVPEVGTSEAKVRGGRGWFMDGACADRI